MKKNTALLLLLSPLFSLAQISFDKQTSLLTPTAHRSGVAIAVTDMNGDGLDDIIRLNQGKIPSIAFQNGPGQPFTTLELGTASTDNAWGVCTADVDNNGFGDILFGGSYDGVFVYKSNGDASAFSKNTLVGPGTFVQGVNFADINNDGWLDAFVCHDDGVSRIWGNNQDGTFTYQPNWIDLTTYPDSDDSGNYGSVWSDIDNDGDLDLYIAKCRQNVNSATDPRRINQLFLNNGDGTYTQDITNASGLRIGAQSWTADFGDIDNDGDFDCFVTNHDVSSQLLENDGSGHFTDITVEAGLFDVVQGVVIQGVFTDLDNDGLVDILVAGSKDYVFRNNGNKTFSSVENAFDAFEMESYALGDLNDDGYVDVYAGYANTFNTPSDKLDALWMNAGSGKNHIGFRLRGGQSNKDGVGAKIVVYSPLGKQTREVRSGQSYGISNSLKVHFGLNTDAIVDSVVVYWPSGNVDKFLGVQANQYMTVYEGGCALSTIKIEANGPTTFCTGQQVEISAPEGFSHYLWSNGDTTQKIVVNSAGTFKVVVTDTMGCSVGSNLISIFLDPVQIPTIAALSDTTFCNGGKVTLLASQAQSYLWSNGQTTQSIEATESGAYYVNATGLCDVFQSAPITVTALDNPLPVVQNDTVAVNSTAQLFMSNGTPYWYQNADDLNSFSQDNPLILPNMAQSDTFWVTTRTNYDQPNQHVGMINHQGGTTSDNSYNGGIYFDAYKPFLLEKVKVYTNVPGARRLVLKDENGTELDTALVYIPTGTTTITVNIDVPAGTKLLLTTDPAQNQQAIGTAGPQLRRSNQGVNYPYVLDGMLAMTNSTFDSTRYYYFYDWEINPLGYACESARLPVVVYVDSSLVLVEDPAWNQGLALYPNPANGKLTLNADDFTGGEVLLEIFNAAAVPMLRTSRTFEAGTINWTVPTEGLPVGAYWLSLRSEQGTARRKFTIQR